MLCAVGTATLTCSQRSEGLCGDYGITGSGISSSGVIAYTTIAKTIIRLIDNTFY